MNIQELTTVLEAQKLLGRLIEGQDVSRRELEYMHEKLRRTVVLADERKAAAAR
jgi:hypothetical protein